MNIANHYAGLLCYYLYTETVMRKISLLLLLLKNVKWAPATGETVAELLLLLL